MLTVEELVEVSLIEEGQFLLGEEFITDTLGFGWDKLHKVFVKALKEYARRHPIVETTVMTADSTAGVFFMPEGTLAVRAIRYNMLDDYPRTLFSDFGQINYEFDPHTGRLRTFSPMSSLRITYSREYTMSDSATVTQKEYMVDYEDEALFKLACKPKKKTIVVTQNSLSMEETGIEKKQFEDASTGVKTLVKLIKLEGDLGTGYYNPNTRELEVRLNEGADGDLVVTCKPMFPVVTELDIGNYIFTKLFKSYMLEAVASLRSQATQQDLQDIDLNVDDLHARAMILRSEVKQLLKDTIDFSAMAPI